MIFINNVTLTVLPVKDNDTGYLLWTEEPSERSPFVTIVPQKAFRPSTLGLCY